MRNPFMLITSRILVTIFGLTLLSNTSLSQIVPNFDRLRTELQRKVASKEIPSVSIGVTRRGTVLWKESFGLSDVENGLIASPDTIYALGSLSKSITGTALFRLVQDRKVDLGDPVNKYLRSLRINFHGRNAKAYKVFHLLNMTAGIPHAWRYCYADAGDFKECSDQLTSSSAVSAFRAGQVHLYSNASFGVASHLIEDVSGMPFGGYLRSNIFAPAGMNSTFTHRREIKKIADLAKPYRSDGSLAADLQFEPSGGGGLYSSVNDLLKYGELHLGRTNILTKDTLAENHRVRSEQPHGYYANGWGGLPIHNFGSTLLSNGAIEGAASTMLVMPEKELVIVVLTNKTVGNDMTDAIGFQIADSILPGYKQELDRLFAKVGPLFDSESFEGREDLDGDWKGEIELNGQRLPLLLKFRGKVLEGEFKGVPVTISRVTSGQGLIRPACDSAGNGPVRPSEIICRTDLQPSE